MLLLLPNKNLREFSQTRRAYYLSDPFKEEMEEDHRRQVAASRLITHSNERLQECQSMEASELADFDLLVQIPEG